MKILKCRRFECRKLTNVNGVIIYNINTFIMHLIRETGQVTKTKLLESFTLSNFNNTVVSH